MKITTTDGKEYDFIDECAHCELDTAGNHQFDCPCNPNYKENNKGEKMNKKILEGFQSKTSAGIKPETKTNVVFLQGESKITTEVKAKKIKSKKITKAKKIKSKKRIYLAAPFFTPKEIATVDNIKLLCESLGFDVFSPKDDNLITNFDSIDERQKGFDRNVKEVKKVDLMLAVIDNWDCGTTFEMGIAYKVGTPILAYSNVAHRGLNLMMAHSCIGFANGIEDLKKYLKQILEGTYVSYIWEGEVI